MLVKQELIHGYDNEMKFLILSNIFESISAEQWMLLTAYTSIPTPIWGPPPSPTHARHTIIFFFLLWLSYQLSLSIMISGYKYMGC